VLGNPDTDCCNHTDLASVALVKQSEPYMVQHMTMQAKQLLSLTLAQPATHCILGARADPKGNNAGILQFSGAVLDIPPTQD